jgi:hypothetical protein
MVAPLVSVVSYLSHCRVENRVVNKGEREPKAGRHSQSMREVYAPNLSDGMIAVAF